MTNAIEITNIDQIRRDHTINTDANGREYYEIHRFWMETPSRYYLDEIEVSPRWECAECGYIHWEGDDANDCCTPNPVREYGYKPAPVFYHTAKEPFLPSVTNWYCGIELEVDDGIFNKGLFREVMAKLPQVYLKRDGSLSEDGVEMVFHPQTLDYIKEQETAYKEVFDLLKNKGYRSHNTDTCGLHIHISRECFGAFDSINIARLVTLVDNLLRQDDGIDFTRRRECELDDWASPQFDFLTLKSLAGKKTAEANKEARSKLERYDRYKAVNLKNEHTIELRFFKGTLKWESFLACVEFAKALTEFVRKPANGIPTCAGISFADFIKFAETKGHTALISYCRNRGLY